MPAAKKKSEDIVEIKPIKLERVKLRVVGETPLIVHAWSEKAKRQMLEASGTGFCQHRILAHAHAGGGNLRGVH